MDIFRALLLEAMIEELVAGGFGIRRSCLRRVRDQIDRILHMHHLEFLRDAREFLKAVEGVRELTRRMMASARAEGERSVREVDHAAALSQCGIIFFCDPPEGAEEAAAAPAAGFYR